MVPEDEDEASKTEEPSERKISKAREEGDIAISQDAKSFIMLLGMLFVVWLIIPLMGKWFYRYFGFFIERPETIPTDSKHLQLLMVNCVIDFFKLLGIPFAIFMVLGVLASLMQTGFIFAPQKLMPNWNKLNIFAALPKFINMQKIVESLKGIIKINNRFFAPEDINKIALVAPTATLIEIKDFEVIKKHTVEVPDYVDNIVKCFNPNCVTNKERDIPTKFNVIKDENGVIKLRCHYCEKYTTEDNMTFI